jgi:hypothetical protein
MAKLCKSLHWWTFSESLIRQELMLVHHGASMSAAADSYRSQDGPSDNIVHSIAYVDGWWMYECKVRMSYREEEDCASDPCRAVHGCAEPAYRKQNNARDQNLD